MGCVARGLGYRGAIPLGCALAALWPNPANAQHELRLFTPDALELSGDVRLVAVDGEHGWTRGAFGKLRSGSDGHAKLQPQLGNVSLVWKPQFTWSLGATVVASVQGGQRTQAGLSQAFVTFKPMRSSKLAFSARAGLMWPPISLEHEGADWHVKDSITRSAINSWIGEEVRPAAAEATLAASVGRHKLRATAALIAANDTAATLLTFRGWALHDRTTLAFHRQPLPPLGPDFTGVQAPFTHPLIDLHEGFARHVGYYAMLGWLPPIPLRVELFHYDNRADPQDVNAGPEWGWHTRFDHVGVVAELGSGMTLKAQALQGRTHMGYAMPVHRWIDERFRAGFVMLTRPLGSVGLAVRADAFGTRNRGSLWSDEYNERGWSAMLAAQRQFGPVTGLAELLHVSSDTPAREFVGQDQRQRQTQVQAELRMRW